MGRRKLTTGGGATDGTWNTFTLTDKGNAVVESGLTVRQAHEIETSWPEDDNAFRT